MIFPKILNLSSTKLSEIKILSKGFKFTPTPKRNVHELKRDTENFTRKLRLIEFFAHEADYETNSLVKKKGKFTPPRDRDKTLDIVIDFLHKQKFNPFSEKQKSNITKEEYSGIMELKNNTDIIIKEADKGGAVIVMNKEHYSAMIKKQLNDDRTYKVTTENCDKKVLKNLQVLCEKYKNDLTDEEKDYWTKFQSKTSNFYGLPKVHKSKIIKEAIVKQNAEYIECLEPCDLKVRPIVAGPNCPTRNLSNLLDKILKPLLIHVKSHIKDNLNFLKECSRVNNANTILATFDIVSLYTNIPHEFGLEALKYWVENHPNSIHSRFSKEFILEATRICFKK